MSISIKQADIAIDSFNNQTCKQLTQLKDHKLKIKRFLQVKDYNGIKREEIGALRCIKNIKNILVELQQLRSKVRQEDLELFDKKVSMKEDALKEIKSFLDMELKPPDKYKNGVNQDIPRFEDEFEEIPPIQTYFELDEYQLKARAALLNDMESLENEFRELFGVFTQVHNLVHDQAEPIAHIAENVEIAEVNVQQGTQHLRTALKYQKAAYPLVGGVLGACVAGPFGLLIGLKTGASLMAAGGLASAFGGVVGYSGGNIIKKEAIVDGTVPQEQTVPK